MCLIFIRLTPHPEAVPSPWGTPLHYIVWRCFLAMCGRPAPHLPLGDWRIRCLRLLCRHGCGCYSSPHSFLTSGPLSGPTEEWDMNSMPLRVPGCQVTRTQLPSLPSARRQLFGSRWRWGVCAVASVLTPLPGYHDATASFLPDALSAVRLAPGIEACVVRVGGRPEWRHVGYADWWLQAGRMYKRRLRCLPLYDPHYQPLSMRRLCGSMQSTALNYHFHLQTQVSFDP